MYITQFDSQLLVFIRVSLQLRLQVKKMWR